MTADTMTRLGVFVSNKRRTFNPKSKADLKELAYFRNNNQWRNGCPFYLEWPFMDIPSMCMSRYVDLMLSH